MLISQLSTLANASKNSNKIFSGIFPKNTVSRFTNFTLLRDCQRQQKFSQLHTNSKHKLKMFFLLKNICAETSKRREAKEGKNIHIKAGDPRHRACWFIQHILPTTLPCLLLRRTFGRGGYFAFWIVSNLTILKVYLEVKHSTIFWIKLLKSVISFIFPRLLKIIFISNSWNNSFI